MTTTGEMAKRGRWAQAGRDVAYLLPGLLIVLPAFVLLITGFFLGIGLMPLALIGIVIWQATLMTARGFAAFERRRLGLMEGRVVGPVYHRPAAATGRWRHVTSAIRDPQTWKEWGYFLIRLPMTLVTWSIALTWCAGAIGGTTWFLWAWPLADDSQGLAYLLGWDSNLLDGLINTGLGIVFLLTLPIVVRGLAASESALAWGMLTNESSALRARAEELTRSRQAVVQAESDTLRRVERDIHDGPQQRLVRLTMDLQSAQRRLADDPTSVSPLINGALVQTQEALAELRALSRGIAPPILTDRGLPAALAAAAARSPVPTTLDIDFHDGERLPTPVESAAYFVVTESLTNVAKHSGAAAAQVRVIHDDAAIRITVSDDGRGGAHPGKGQGLAGLADRLAGVDGQIAVDSPPGGGTVIEAVIPLAP